MTDIDSIKIELLKVGLKVNDVYDLVNSAKSYSSAIPVLINLLKEGVQPIKLREGVIRALAVKEAIGKIGKLLIDEYNKTPKNEVMLRWAIGNTFFTTAKNENVDDVIEIVSNKSNGISRQMFVSSLGKLKSEKSENVLIELLGDSEVASHALYALARMKSEKARKSITGLLNHPNRLIRREASKALKKLDSVKEID